MANEYEYTQGVSPDLVHRADEEPKGLIPANGNGNGSVVRIPKTHGRFPGGKRDTITLAKMKASISACYADGVTYEAIAERVSDEFGLDEGDRLTVKNIEYHISTLKKQARTQAALHINERQALALARIDQLEMLVTEAYFASMSQSTIHHERMIKTARSKEREKQLRDDLKREQARVKKKNIRRAKEHKKLLPIPTLDHIKGDLEDLMVMTAENVKEYSRKEERPAGDPRFAAMLIDLTDRRAKLWGLFNRSDITNPDQDLAKMPDDERRSRLAAVLHSAQSQATGDKGTLARPSPLGGFTEEQKPTEEVIEHDPIRDWEFE